MYKTLLSVLILFAVIPVTSIAQPTKINLEKGQKFEVKTTTKMNNSVEIWGQTSTNNLDTKTTSIIEIMNTGKKTVDLQSVITKMAVAATSMGQQSNYDSELKNNEGPLADTLANIINKKKKITIDNKGAITNQDENNGAGIDGISASNTFTTELFIPALIGKKLKKNDSFTDISSNTKDNYSIRESGTYSVTAVKNGVANISYTGTEVIKDVKDQMGMEMTVNSNNKVVIEMQVDIKTGLVLVKTSVNDSVVSIDVSGMTIPSTGKTITTTSITQVQ